ncbi:hypothetical protein bAD24_III10145 [Burkholderia sp. AD24]|nr:hypothetical protein bAD24_III10145 [Burkholderia sp. AD24]
MAWVFRRGMAWQWQRQPRDIDCRHQGDTPFPSDGFFRAAHAFILTLIFHADAV